jgi:hypothetical protein
MQTTKATSVEKSLFAEEIQTAYAHVSVISEVTGIVLVILMQYLKVLLLSVLFFCVCYYF